MSPPIWTSLLDFFAVRIVIKDYPPLYLSAVQVRLNK